MVTTDDDELAERLRHLVDHGRTGRYRHDVVGYNYRMTNLHAAIGADQLDRLPGWVDKRRENAATLTAGLESIDRVRTPVVPSGRTHAFHQYTVSTPDRESLRGALEEADIGYGIYYPTPIPDQPAYDVETACPVARAASERVLSLPVHPALDEDDVDRIVTVVNDWEEGEV